MYLLYLKFFILVFFESGHYVEGRDTTVLANLNWMTADLTNDAFRTLFDISFLYLFLQISLFFK